MPYSIRKSDGTLLINLEDGVKNTSLTSLTLIGKMSTDYGKVQNENFIKLLENFAGNTEPVNSTLGQLWFDTTNQQLQVKTDQGFQPLGPFDASVTTYPVDSNEDVFATTRFVHRVVPKGVILLWSGAANNIPSGWRLCDGNNDVAVNGQRIPDLRNKFILGAGTSTPAVDSTGGSATISQVVAHSHNFSAVSSGQSQGHSHSGVSNAADSHAHIMPGDDQLAFGAGQSGWPGTTVGNFQYDAKSTYGGGNGTFWLTGSAGSHNHTITLGENTQDHSHQVAGSTNSVGQAEINIINPYYALAYIIKVV